MKIQDMVHVRVNMYHIFLYVQKQKVIIKILRKNKESNKCEKKQKSSKKVLKKGDVWFTMELSGEKW